MDSQTIVERYGAKLKGQQLLFPEHEYTLRHTPFQPTGDRDFDRETLVHWWMHVYIPDGYGSEKTPYEIYQTWSNGLWPLFLYCKPSGYLPETYQSAIQLSCYKNEPLEDHLADVRLWLPHCKPFTYKDKKGESRPGVHVGIFERTLSEHGVYDLRVWSETDMDLGKTTYGRYQVLQHFTSLEEAVAYIQKHHYYEKSRTHEETGEDGDGEG